MQGIETGVKQHRRAYLNRLPALAKQQIESANLPQLYVQAKASLVALDRIDEVKEIADKHTAIAHYAKQIRDNSLRKYAERIYLRALSRIGELLNDLSPADRKSVSANSGLSESTAAAARNIASIPKDKFDALIEREDVPTRSEVSSAGAFLRNGEKLRPMLAKDPFSLAGAYRAQIDELRARIFTRAGGDRFGGVLADTHLVASLSRVDAGMLRDQLVPIIEALDSLAQRLKARAG